MDSQSKHRRIFVRTGAILRLAAVASMLVDRHAKQVQFLQNRRGRLTRLGLIANVNFIIVKQVSMSEVDHFRRRCWIIFPCRFSENTSIRMWSIFPIPPFEFFRVGNCSVGVCHRQAVNIQGTPVYLNTLKLTIFPINLLWILPFQGRDGGIPGVDEVLRHLIPDAGDSCQVCFTRATLRA